MNDLSNFKEEINNCSRCGLCQSVCPVYEITKNDCTSPKGKCIMLNNLLKNGGSPSKNMKKYMKMCSNCGKCLDFCPSKIDIVKINKAFQKQYLKYSINNLKIFQKMFIVFMIFAIKIKKLKNKSVKISKNKKIIYVKPYNKNEIPDFIKRLNIDIINSYNCDLNFIINNLTLSKEISKNLVKNILDKGYDCILVDNILCKLELEIAFENIKPTKNIMFVNEFMKNIQ